MPMKRRLPALLLALLLLGIVPTPARAEPDQAFVPVLTYPITPAPLR